MCGRNKDQRVGTIKLSAQIPSITSQSKRKHSSQKIGDTGTKTSKYSKTKHMILTTSLFFVKFFFTHLPYWDDHLVSHLCFCMSTIWVGDYIAIFLGNSTLLWWEWRGCWRSKRTGGVVNDELEWLPGEYNYNSWLVRKAQIKRSKDQHATATKECKEIICLQDQQISPGPKKLFLNYTNFMTI